MRWIIDKSESVLKEFGGKNVFETAENAGCNVWFRGLGSLKGFYICENNKRYIVINEELGEAEKAVVCAHELGHDMLHRELSAGGIRENTLFLNSNKTEREANLFAAEVLISDEDMLSSVESCQNAAAAAALLGFPREIVEFKLEALNFKGCSFKTNGAASDFLK